MNATKIESGHLLKLRKDNAYGFSGDDLCIRVAGLRFKPGYKTPWVIDIDGRAFRPSDFSGFAVDAK